MKKTTVKDASGRYELTGENQKIGKTVVYRIRALKSFSTGKDGLISVRKGDLGGFVSDPDRISGNAWVREDAVVMGGARLTDNSVASGKAVVRGRAVLSKNAYAGGGSTVSGNARLTDDSTVDGFARIFGSALVGGSAYVLDCAEVSGHAEVGCRAVVRGKAKVSKCAIVAGLAQVEGNAEITDYAHVVDVAEVRGQVLVGGKTLVAGKANLTGDAVVMENFDFAVYMNTWSSGRYVTYTRSNGMWRAGCFYGTGNELAAKAMLDGPRSGMCYAELVKFQEHIDGIRAERAGGSKRFQT